MSNNFIPAVTVNLNDRSYPVFIGTDCFSGLVPAIKKYFGDRQLALITNTNLAFMYHDAIEQFIAAVGAPVVQCVVPDGEQYKTIETWGAMLDTLLQARIDRTTVLVAFGGGVVGDMAGFAAASVLRGIEAIQIPTTLLAMVDSSVGGKTGINHRMGKNLIGAFHQPSMVWVDTAYLSTLPEREFVAGMAEVIKYAFIGGSEAFDSISQSLEKLLAHDTRALISAITLCIQIKADVVSQDERETGLRALLNFGHTFGHALEHFYGYGTLLHGEGVLWGIRCACALGRAMGTIPAMAWPQYARLLEKMPVVNLPAAVDCDALFNAMFSDKKAKQGVLRFVIPAEPGTSHVRGDVEKDMVLAVLSDVLK